VSNSFPEFVPVSPYKVNSITDMNPVSLGEIRSFLEQDPPRIPIKQVTGFTQFNAQSAFVATQENTSSTVYGALTTPGPTLSNLAPGSYVLLYGATSSIVTGASGTGYCAPSVNGAPPASGSDCAIGVFGAGGTMTSSAMASAITLTSEGGNTVELQYKVAGIPTLSFSNRWLLALRYD
jgi:hypothetical protein